MQDQNSVTSYGPPIIVPLPTESEWWRVIDRAERRGRFTKKERIRAGAWPTCACGVQDRRLTHPLSHMPFDNTLHDLGVDFADAVATNDFDGARSLVAAIEAVATGLTLALNVEEASA